ncbi:MAG: asparagine synthase (glutamine-hydrolyzing) [bacterium]
MCGICGKLNFSGEPVSEGELRRMNSLMLHRGPDDEGYFTGDGIGLAMRRLSIIDLSTGRQPISNEDRTIWVILNGEIYNFCEIREGLEKRGHVFSTRSDTEAIVHLYEEKGEECVQELRGMFAFALWDSRGKKLMLARDRVGKKPLLYAQTGRGLTFASEMKPLLAAGGISRDIDFQALDLYLSLQYIPGPLAVFKGAKKLPPAHILIADVSGVRVKRYWDLPMDSRFAGDEQDAMAEIRERLKEAVRLRMMTDVPLGAFLSGGIDSSAVVALMSGLSEKPVKTFSIGFEEAGFSELEYAGQVAKMYGCEHNEFIVRAEMTEVLPLLAEHYGEPYADSSALPSYFVAKETRKHVTVALNGDGGDENFAGYSRYAMMKMTRHADFLPEQARRSLMKLCSLLPGSGSGMETMWRIRRFLENGVFAGLPARHLKLVSYFNKDEKDFLYTAAMKQAAGTGAEGYIAGAFEKTGGLDFINRLLYADFHTYLPECLLVKMDIATMANSLEARSPFLDHRFMEFVFSLPGEWKLKGARGLKWILREAFKEKLPPAVYSRGKQGFGIAVDEWFRGKLRKRWEELCLGRRAVKRGYFRREALLKFWEDHQSGKRNHGYRLWALMMLELWHEAFSPDGGL